MRPTFSLILALILGLAPLSAQAATSAASSVEKEVDGLETRLFLHDYPTDEIDDRLSRLEKMVFGESRSGTDQQRIAELLAAVPADNPEAMAPAGASSSSAQATSSSTSSSIRGAPAASNQTQVADDDVITNASQYPHVTALEHELLGRTNTDEPVTRRLDQLETKAFGKPSASADLSARTDKLEQYVEVHLHKAPFARNPEMEMAETSPINYNQRGGGAIPASYSAPAVPQGPPRFMPPPPPSSPMLEKVTWMEGQVFGQTYSDQHLLERLRRLDQSLFPNEQPTSDMKLMDQVDSLVGAVEMIQHQRQQSGAPQYTASAQPDGADAYKDAQPDRAESEAGAQPAAEQPNKHPFVKEFAHCLGEAGNMALGMTGNSVGGPGGMGPGYWY